MAPGLLSRHFATLDFAAVLSVFPLVRRLLPGTTPALVVGHRGVEGWDRRPAGPNPDRRPAGPTRQVNRGRPPVLLRASSITRRKTKSLQGRARQVPRGSAVPGWSRESR